jgi:DNA-binding transcriptional ArsR family regulator
MLPMDNALHALSDESRRVMLEALRTRPASAGELASLLPIARPGASRHLKVLRDAGLVDVRGDGQFRIYSLRPEPLAEVDRWLSPYRDLWQQRLDALHTEVARGKHERKRK